MFYNMRNTYVLTKVKLKFGKYKSIYVLEFFFFFCQLSFMEALNWPPILQTFFSI